jgi:hypothetical protein
MRRRRTWLAPVVSTGRTIAELSRALWRQKLKSYLPAMIVLAILAIILSVLTALSPIAPFVYPLF